MDEKTRISYYKGSEHLTDVEGADGIWYHIVESVKEAGRQDILSSPTVLDIGGGLGEFSKYLNSQGINCVSLDIQDLPVDPLANPVRGNIYRMPFRDASFDILHGRGVFDNAMYWHSFPKLVQEIARVLKNKGILAINDFRPPPGAELGKLFRRLSID